MTTERFYFENMNCYEIFANVIGVSIENNAVVLDKTIFHVKGGGQPSDVGHINDCKVTHVFCDEDNKILHQIVDLDAENFVIGSVVKLKIDVEKRRYHSRLHTAGHLLAGVVEKLYPQLSALSGSHIPSQSRVIFKGENIPEKDLIAVTLKTALEAAIQSDSKVTVGKVNGTRAINIQDFHQTICGGTHVSQVSEIGNIIIRKIKIKNNELTISYDVSE